MQHTVDKERKIVLYIVYGENQVYYDGAIFNYLTFSKWIYEKDQIEFYALTEYPEKFKSYPIKTLLIDSKNKKNWSLDGKYHFRIKNRGLAHFINLMELKSDDKILFFDSDTYFRYSPLPLFSYISSNQAVCCINEGLIYKKKRFIEYVKNLDGKVINFGGESYKLSKNSMMRNSQIIGLMPSMIKSLDYADSLMIKMIEFVPAHTIEQFALFESLSKDYKIFEGKKFISIYSTNRKKQYAENILAEFFRNNSSLNIKNQIILAYKLNLKRSFIAVLKKYLNL
jgi:heptosyltransferase-3